MGEWIGMNKREDRALHKYTLEKFGLSEAKIKTRFTGYREQVIETA